MDDLLSHSITYRIAVGPHQGRKAFTLQTIPAWTGDIEERQLANAGGFSLHAGVAAEADERQKLERLCRYIARQTASMERLPLTSQGHIRYALNTPYRDGTTHVVLEPLDFIARLAAWVPKPRVNLTRFHGVFAPNSHLRAQVTPGQRGKRTGGSGAGHAGGVPSLEPLLHRGRTGCGVHYYVAIPTRRRAGHLVRLIQSSDILHHCCLR